MHNIKRSIAILAIFYAGTSAIQAANIQDVLDNKVFQFTACNAQTTPSVTSVTLYNPPGSGVVYSLVKSAVWSSTPTEFNLKRTNTVVGFGTDLNIRNSKYFPGTSAIVQSKSRLYRLSTGVTPAANSIEVYSANTQPQQDEYPMSMGPGEGLAMIPDTSGTINWCWSGSFFETPAP